MDLRKLKTLIDLVSESNVSELEITEAEGKVRIVKADPRAAMVSYAPAPAVALPVAAAHPVAIAAAEAPAIRQASGRCPEPPPGQASRRPGRRAPARGNAPARSGRRCRAR